MSLIDFLKNNCSNSRTLASYYTDVHSAGFAFHINGRLTNLWEATNLNGKKEYFILDHEICWNTMCRISNNHMTFRPDPNDFVLKDADSYVDLDLEKLVGSHVSEKQMRSYLDALRKDGRLKTEGKNKYLYYVLGKGE